MISDGHCIRREVSDHYPHGWFVKVRVKISLDSAAVYLPFPPAPQLRESGVRTGSLEHRAVVVPAKTGTRLSRVYEEIQNICGSGHGRD